MPRRSTIPARAATALADTQAAVFLVNARRQFVLFNRGCERETGWIASELAEHRADYVTEADPQTVTAAVTALAPPPEVWHGTVVCTPMNLPHRTGPPQPRLVHFFPLVDTENAVTHVLGVITATPPPGATSTTPLIQTLHSELAALRHSLRQQYGERTLIVRSPAMLRVLQQVKIAQAVAAPVLLVGEAGSGCEHLARMIHYGSPRGRQSFVPYDCSAIDPLELKRSLRHLTEELRAGSDNPLSPGTVFFSQLQAASPEVLLRLHDFVAQEPPLRIMAASQRSPEVLLQEQRLPRELYFRLTSLAIEIPPLRERLEDLAPLAQLFLEEWNRDADAQVSGFAADVLEQFRRYHWPGNLDELRAVVVEARRKCTGPQVLPAHLPFRFRTGVEARRTAPRQTVRPVPLDELLQRVEREQIELALAEARGHVSQAAELLAIPRARLYRRLEQLGIRHGTDAAAEGSSPE